MGFWYTGPTPVRFPCAILRVWPIVAALSIVPAWNAHEAAGPLQSEAIFQVRIGTALQLARRSADDDVIAARVQHPVVSFAWIVVVSRNFHETFVQRQVVTNRVLPALSVVAIVWKILQAKNEEYYLEFEY